MRYWDIAEALRADIAGGRYAVGDKLPTEEQLVEAFDASRHAVREALRLLTEDGLISRRPRAGSLVIGQSPRAQFTQLLHRAQAGGHAQAEGRRHAGAAAALRRGRA
ncbi:MAG: GntR family transcriptional regulator, partial [Comamonadaceae bacterium]